MYSRFTKLWLGCFLTAISCATAFAQSSTPTYVFTHLAGPLGGWGNADGTRLTARFNTPLGVAADNAGNIYVADRNNGTIRKISSSGVVSTFAGTAGVFGGADGTGSAAQFNAPSGVAADNAGNIYVADKSSCAIRKITPTGAVTTFAGRQYGLGSSDGTGSAARFYYPSSVAVDAAGNVFVADTGNMTVRKITPDGVVTTVAGMAGYSGSADGVGSAARFLSPVGIAVDYSGNVYVTDGTIRKITSDGVVTTLAGSAEVSGTADGTGSAAQFLSPSGVVVDKAGNLFVSDYWGDTLRKITPTGVVTTFAGNAGYNGGTADGTGPAARFNQPAGMAMDNSGYIYVADSGNDTLRKIAPDGTVSTLAGAAGPSGFDDGNSTGAKFNHPTGVAVDSTGNVFVADANNNTVRKIAPNGTVTTFAGMVNSFGGADGIGSAAYFDKPSGLAIDRLGNVYVADRGNDAIRMITPEAVVTTLAGILPPPIYYAGVNNWGRIPGGVDGTGSAAQFYNPSGLTVDSAGNVFVADTENGSIRKITPRGVVTTLAGPVGPFIFFGLSSLNGIGSAARFSKPHGAAVDNAGNVFVTDTDDEIVRKITSDGVVTTFAGMAGVIGFVDGAGTAAQFNSPSGIAIDKAGNLYVTDSGNNCIRMITPNGLVTTVAGSAFVTGSADGIGSAAQFNSPMGLAIDAAGNLYVADSNNNAVRKGMLAGPPVITTQPQNLSTAIGSSVQLVVDASSPLPLTYQWFLNQIPIGGATGSSLTLSGASTANAGNYAVTVTNQLGSVTSSTATVAVVSPAMPQQTNSGAGALSEWLFGSLAILYASRYRKRIVSDLHERRGRYDFLKLL